jgi:dTDP-4-dehydrorhamnose reductase
MRHVRVLILGGSGMLGHRVWELLRGRFDTWVAVRRRPDCPLFGADERVVEGLDATGFARLERLIAELTPAAVVNCIGIVKQLAAAHDPIASITVNALFPHVVARSCAHAGARLIQISTDCVFSGRRGGYAESDVPSPADLYGRSKLLGEVDKPHLTLRTSIIGRELQGAHGLVEWFLANRGGHVSGFTRARFSGLTTLELARVIGDVIERHPELEGLYHVAAEPISKYDLLMLLNAAFDAGVTIDPNDALALDRSLDGSRFREATGWTAPPWPEMVEALARDAEAYEEWRAR